MKNAALVFAGLVLGGVLAVVATRNVHAESPATAPARPRWQQYCEPAASVPEASTIASIRGIEGWELVAFSGGAVCFKRVDLGPPPKKDVAWPGY
jgi:hypothetical protein